MKLLFQNELKCWLFFSFLLFLLRSFWFRIFLNNLSKHLIENVNTRVYRWDFEQKFENDTFFLLINHSLHAHFHCFNNFSIYSRLLFRFESLKSFHFFLQFRWFVDILIIRLTFTKVHYNSSICWRIDIELRNESTKQRRTSWNKHAAEHEIKKRTRVVHSFTVK